MSIRCPHETVEVTATTLSTVKNTYRFIELRCRAGRDSCISAVTFLHPDLKPNDRCIPLFAPPRSQQFIIFGSISSHEKYMKLEIKVLEREDIPQLYELLEVFDKTFEYPTQDRASGEHLTRLLSGDSFVAIVARADDKVIAGLTAYVLHQYHSEKPILYVQDLAVLPDYQRKGVGSKLIGFTGDHCRKENCELCFIQAEEIDDYAIEFYRSTRPAKEEAVVIFTYNFA